MTKKKNNNNNKTASGAAGGNGGSNEPQVTYDIETRFKNVDIPGVLTFDNRFPIYGTIVPTKLQQLYPACSFEYTVASEDELEPRVVQVIPKSMCCIFCSVTGPKSQAAKAYTSLKQAFEHQGFRSNREETEFLLDASSLLDENDLAELEANFKKNTPAYRQAHQQKLEQRLISAKGNARRAAASITINISFVRRKNAFFCSTIFLPEEKNTKPSVSEMHIRCLQFLRQSNITRQNLRRVGGGRGGGRNDDDDDEIYEDESVSDSDDETSSDDSSDSSDDDSSDSDAESRASESSSDAEEERKQLKKRADDAAKKNAGRGGRGGRGGAAASSGRGGGGGRGGGNNNNNNNGSPSFGNGLIPYEDMKRIDSLSPNQALTALTSMIEDLNNRMVPNKFPLQWYSFLYYCESSYCRHRLAQWEMPHTQILPHTQVTGALLIHLPTQEEQERMRVQFPPFSERRPSVGVGDTVVIHIPSEELVLEAPVYAVFPRQLGLMCNNEVRISEISNIKHLTNNERPNDVLLRVAQENIPVHITFDAAPFGFRCSALSAAALRGERWYDFLVNPNDDDPYNGDAPVTQAELIRNADRVVPDAVRRGTTGMKNRGELSPDQLAVVSFMIKPPRNRHELCINGPPGTGKTEVLARGIFAILEKDPKARILVTSTSHSAVDNLFTRCLFLALDNDAKKYKDRRGRDTFIRKNFFRFYRSRKMPRSVAAHVLPYTNLFPMVPYNELGETSAHKFDEDLANQIMPTMRVVFTNITAISKLRFWRQQFTHVIVDEAQQASLCEGFLALDVLDTNAPQHQLVLAGDTEQIRPHVLFPKIRQWLEQSTLAVANKNTERFCTLGLQESFRATSELADIQSAIFYKGKLRAADASLHSPDTEVKDLVGKWSKKNMQGSDAPIQFIHIKGQETIGEADASQAENMKERSAMTFSNPSETTCIAAVIGSMMQFGIKGSSIVVLTNFKAQRKAIEQRLQLTHRKGAVRVTSLEEFQGQEADIIIISLVRNEKDDNFLNKNDLNTILSRQRVLAIIVGDAEMVAKASSKKWTSVMEWCKDPKNKGMFNYDYNNEQLINSPTFDLEISGQASGLNIKEFKPKTTREKSILFKEYTRQEILADPQQYFIGRVRWFDASRLASYNETSDDAHRFLVASNRFNADIDVKIDMTTDFGMRKFFCVPGDIVALVVEGLQNRIAPLARGEYSTRRIFFNTDNCWQAAPNYHYGSQYVLKNPLQIAYEAKQNNNNGGRGRGGRGGRGGGRGRGYNNNNDNNDMTDFGVINMPNEDVDIEIMTPCAYQIFEDEDESVFAHQQYAGLPVCILRYAKLPPILCEVKMTRKINRTGRSRIVFGDANPTDKRFPSLTFDEDACEKLALLDEKEKQDSKVVRFWCELIRPPLNDPSLAEKCKNMVNFYRPIRVERAISISDRVISMQNVPLPTSSIHSQLPIGESAYHNLHARSVQQEQQPNTSIDVSFMQIASQNNNYVGFSIFDPKNNNNNNNNNNNAPPPFGAPGFEHHQQQQQQQPGGFSSFGFGFGSAAASGNMNNNNNHFSGFNNNMNNNSNNNNNNNVNNLNGDLRVGIHIPLVNDRNLETQLLQNGVVTSAGAPRVPAPQPANGPIEVLSIYTDISCRQGVRNFQTGDTFFKVERLGRFTVGRMQEPLQKLSRKIEDSNDGKRLKFEEKIVSFFADYCGAKHLCYMLPSQALLTRKHVRQVTAEGADFYDLEWYVPTLTFKENSWFVNVFNDNAENTYDMETRPCQPFTNLGSLVVQRQMMLVAAMDSSTTSVDLQPTEKVFLREARELAAWVNGLTYVRSNEEFE